MPPIAGGSERNEIINVPRGISDLHEGAEGGVDPSSESHSWIETNV